jgi:hypothetical protein
MHKSVQYMSRITLLAFIRTSTLHGSTWRVFEMIFSLHKSSSLVASSSPYNWFSTEKILPLIICRVRFPNQPQEKNPATIWTGAQYMVFVALVQRDSCRSELYAICDCHGELAPRRPYIIGPYSSNASQTNNEQVHCTQYSWRQFGNDHFLI